MSVEIEDAGAGTRKGLLAACRLVLFAVADDDDVRAAELNSIAVSVIVGTGSLALR